MRALAETGIFDQPERLLDALVNFEMEDHETYFGDFTPYLVTALSATAAATRAAGLADLALHVTAELAEGSQELELLCSITEALSAIGDDHAEELSSRLLTTIDELSEDERVTLVSALTNLEHFEKAEQLARTLAHPHDRTGTLLAIAEQALDRQHRQRATNITAEILSGPEWQCALMILGTLNPKPSWRSITH